MSMVIRPEQVLREPAFYKVASDLAEDGYMDSAGEVYSEPSPSWYSR